MALTAWNVASYTLRISTSTGLTLTPTMKSKVESKVGRVVEKLGSNVLNSAAVTLKVEPASASNSNLARHIAEVKCVMKGGNVIECKQKTSDMYASIDLVSHSLAQSLKKHRQKVKSIRNNEKIGGSVAESEVDEDAALFAFDEASLLDEASLKYMNS